MTRRGTVLTVAAGFATALVGLLMQAWAATGPISGSSLDAPLVLPNIDAQPDQVGPAGAATKARALTGNPLWAVPLRSLSATRERPIFSPSRRPPPPVVAAQPVLTTPAPARPESDRPQLILVGTIAGETSGIGVFREPATSNIVRLKTGQDYSGWTLWAVRRGEAKFEKDQRKVTLELPLPGAESPAQAALQPPVGTQNGQTWRDGDGQLIAPPPRNSTPAVVRPASNATPTAAE